MFRECPFWSSYATVPDDMSWLVPNPAKKTAAAGVTSAKKALERAAATRDAKLAELKNPAPGTVIITSKMLNRLQRPVDTARRKLQEAQDAAKAVPGKIPLGHHNPDLVRGLDAEAMLITHPIRMAAFNAETMLARALHGHYARAGVEAAALIREALTASGDIIPGDGTLTVRLDPLSAPRRTRALAALCAQLNRTGTRYPGTELTLRYGIKDHPGTA